MIGELYFMKKKNGFTLVELLVTIVLLGVVTTVIIFNVTNISKNSKKTEYERFVASIKSSASVYADMNPEAFQDLYVNKAFIYVTVGNLIDSGLVDEKIKNPYTNEKVKRDELVKASLDTTTAALTFEYPIDKAKDTKTEVFMVAINDYVVWGEPYDCMQGLGSYRLALSDEEGNLITDTNTLKNDYHLACSMPNDFENLVSYLREQRESCLRTFKSKGLVASLWDKSFDRQCSRFEEIGFIRKLYIVSDGNIDLQDLNDFFSYYCLNAMIEAIMQEVLKHKKRELSGNFNVFINNGDVTFGSNDSDEEPLSENEEDEEVVKNIIFKTKIFDTNARLSALRKIVAHAIDMSEYNELFGEPNPHTINPDSQNEWY